MEYKFNFKTEEDKEQLIKDNSHLTLIKIAYHLGESYLVFTDEEIVYYLTETDILGNKISILSESQQSQDTAIIDNMLTITELYEMNLFVSTLSLDIEVPVKIQETYQKLFDLGLKTLEEIPREVRKNIKANK